MALVKKSKTGNGKMATRGNGTPGGEEIGNANVSKKGERRTITVPGRGKMTVTVSQSDKDAVSKDSNYMRVFGEDAATMYAAGFRPKQFPKQGGGGTTTVYVPTGSAMGNYDEAGLLYGYGVNNTNNKGELVGLSKNEAGEYEMSTSSLFDNPTGSMTGRDMINEYAKRILSSRESQVRKLKETGLFETRGQGGKKVAYTGMSGGNKEELESKIKTYSGEDNRGKEASDEYELEQSPSGQVQAKKKNKNLILKKK
jgi:hypothetical protein